MRRSHRFDVVPGQQLFDIGLFVPACDGYQDVGQIAVRLDPVEFACLDQRRDDGPVLCACVMAVNGGAILGHGSGVVVVSRAA